MQCDHRIAKRVEGLEGGLAEGFDGGLGLGRGAGGGAGSWVADKRGGRPQSDGRQMARPCLLLLLLLLLCSANPPFLPESSYLASYILLSV